MKRISGIVAVVVLLGVAPSSSGCGGCLSRADAEQKINDVASGVESSSGEVAAKQEEIRDIRGQICGHGEE